MYLQNLWMYNAIKFKTWEADAAHLHLNLQRLIILNIYKIKSFSKMTAWFMFRLRICYNKMLEKHFICYPDCAAFALSDHCLFLFFTFTHLCWHFVTCVFFLGFFVFYFLKTIRTEYWFSKAWILARSCFWLHWILAMSHFWIFG